MLTTTQSYVTYQGNGATTSFPFNFYVEVAGHLTVSITNNNVSPAQTTVLASTQYAAAGIGNASGGTVTYPVNGSPLPSGWSITIQRIVPCQQATSLSNQGAFYPQVVESALDYLTMIAQQLQAAASGTSPVLPAWISGLQVLTDNNGNVNSATPSLASLAPVYKTANTSATTITGFTNLTAGHYFKIIVGDAHTTFGFGQTGATIKGHNAQNWSPGIGDFLDCVTDGTYVYALDSGTIATLQSYVASALASYSTTAQMNTAINNLNMTSASWTPVLQFGGASTGISYTSQSGEYQTIGKLCIAGFYIALSSKGSATGNATISGLPFAAEGTTGGSCVVNDANLSSISGPILCAAAYNQQSINLVSQGTTGTSAITNSNFNNTTSLTGLVVYFMS
jgi:hypothetical protein